MTTKQKTRSNLAEFPTEQPESTDPGYLAREGAKNLPGEAARRKLEKLISNAKMRKRVGLDD